MKKKYGLSIGLLAFVLFLSNSFSSTTFAADNLFSFPGSPTSKSFKVQKLTSTVSEMRNVDINIGLLSRDIQEFQLELFDGQSFLLKRTRFKVNVGRSNLWRGQIFKQHLTSGGVIDELVGSAVFIIKGNQIRATIHYQNETYKLEPTESGQHILKKVNTAAFPKEHPDETPSPTEPDFSSSNIKTTDSYTDTSSITTAAEVALPADHAVASLEIVRILVVYTPAAAGLTLDIEGDIDLAIANTNSSYANSGIDESVSLQLVHSSEFNYVEGADIFADLRNAESDPYLQGLRDEYLADVVILVTGVSQYCGLASSIYASTEEAFAIVYMPCLAEGVYSLAHEVGHLQGARHNIAADSTIIPFPYGHGYVDQANAFRTIMAYPCINGEVDECPRIPYWSNFNVSYLGNPTGVENVSDNARVLVETSNYIAHLWVNYIPYHLLYLVGFDYHDIDQPPTLSSVSGLFPTTISDGQPMVRSSFGVFDTKNLVFDGAGEIAPFREAITFDIRDEVNRLDIEMELTTNNLVGTAGAQGFINLNFDQPIALTLAETGWVQIDGLDITPFVDDTLVEIIARLNFTDTTLEILVNGSSVHQQALLEYPLHNIEVGIEGSDQHQMALDNFLVTSNGVALSELNAGFLLDNAGAWTDGQISFLATFKNDGPNLAENLSATINIPAELTLDSFSSDELDCLYASFIITCTAINLSANDEAQVSIVTSTVDSNNRFPFSLSVTSDSEEMDLDNNNKTLLLGGDGVLADLEVALSGSPKTVGSRIHVTATVTNNGSDPADNLVLTIPTPSSVIYEANNQTACASFTVDAARVVCGTGLLQSGETFQATITYYSPWFLTRPLFNASVTSDTSDPDLSNNSAKGLFGGSMSYLVIALLLFLGINRRVTGYK